MFVEETWKLFLSFWFPFTLTWAHIGTIPNTMCDTRNASAFSKFNCENFISRNSFFLANIIPSPKNRFVNFTNSLLKANKSFPYPIPILYTKLIHSEADVGIGMEWWMKAQHFSSSSSFFVSPERNPFDLFIKRKQTHKQTHCEMKTEI